jgi:hypothetical protein
VTSAKRVEQLPDVPTVIESGLPGFEVTVFEHERIVPKIRLAVSDVREDPVARSVFETKHSGLSHRVVAASELYERPKLERGQVVRRLQQVGTLFGELGEDIMTNDHVPGELHPFGLVKTFIPEELHTRSPVPDHS